MIETRRFQQGLLLAAGVFAVAVLAVGLAGSDEEEAEWLPPTPGGAVKPQSVSFSASVLVQRSGDELERVWRNADLLPMILRFLHSVEAQDDTHMRWSLRSTLGVSLNLELALRDQAAGSFLHWDVQGDGVAGEVRVSFQQTQQDAAHTVLTVHVELHAMGTTDKPLPPLDTFFGIEPSQRLADDLRRLGLGLERGILKIS